MNWFRPPLRSWLAQQFATLHQRIALMSETTTQALNELKTDFDAEVAANTKFRADVLAALTAIGNAGTLTADQQAIVDALKAEVTQDTAATQAADAALPGQTPPPPTGG